VLTELRSAFAAVGKSYSAQQAEKNTFEKTLVNTHPKVREKLRDTFTTSARTFTSVRTAQSHTGCLSIDFPP
jgi:hypothetical protein